MAAPGVEQAEPFARSWRPSVLAALMAVAAGWSATALGVLTAWLWPTAGTAVAPLAWPWGWDGGWYLGLAQEGWDAPTDGQVPQGTAFLPLWPLLLRAAMHAGVPPDAAGFMLPVACQWVWLVLLHRWVSRSHGVRAGLLAVLAVAMWPHGITGRIAYTEPLFLACGTVALYTLASASRPSPTTLLALALSGGLRVSGLALGGMAFGVRGWFRWAVLMAPALGLACVMTWQYLEFGDALAFLHAQRHWHDGRPPGGWGWAGPLSLGCLGPMGHQGLLKAVMAYGTLAVVLRHLQAQPGAAAAAGSHLLLVLATGWTESGDRYLYGSPALWWLVAPGLAGRPRTCAVLVALSFMATLAWSRNWTLGQWVF